MEVEFFSDKILGFFITLKLHLEGLGYGKLGGNRLLVDGNGMCDTIIVH